ncbi:MAG TPA: response regulator [Bacteroidales bacterium]|nr:response regulator [Bacteroidales bacterium]
MGEISNSEKFNILIVDDRPENLLTLENMLDSPELYVVKASSGNEALSLMLEQDFALVLLDVQMPVMDGFEVAELMRSNEKTRHIPIIFVTAISTERKHIFQGYDAGAVDYLYKPLDLEVLKSKIHSFIAFFKHKQELQRTTNKLEKTVAELHKAKQIAEEATKAKSSFLANMSHEIRTPLNGIIGMADLMMQDELSELQKERLTDLKNSGESLLEIINEILDISKIEAEKLELEDVEFNIRDLLEKVVRLLSVKTLKTDIELVASLTPDLPQKAIGDPTRLRQVLINLLGNAIKFTKHGEIGVHIIKRKETDEHIFLEFAVEDTGMGIPKEKQAKLFQSYEQADKSTTREYGGTGLGLPISKKIVDLMGGDLKLKSTEGKGSRFYFEIKLKKSKTDEPVCGLSSQIADQDLKFLVIDDNETSQRIIGYYLDFWNFKYDAVSNVKDAKAALQNEQYNVIFVDTVMPDFPEIKQLEDFCKQTLAKTDAHVVIMPTSKSAVNMSKYQDLGLKHHIYKPVLQQDIKKVLEELYPDSQQEKKEKQKAEKSDDGHKLRILLAEDQKINRKIVSGLLSKYKWEIIEAVDGQEAFEKATSDNYDLILMDVQMPRMDGYEATRKIRESETGKKHIPIIAMTAHAMKGDKEKCLAAGMDHYLTKPINTAEVVKIINEYTS